jgi:autotransporter translocation and assembly factor TamB
MRFWRVLSLIFLVGALASVLLAADISGKWASKGEEGPQWVFNFKVDGSKVTGTMQGTDGKERPINDGKLDGDALSFSVNSEWQGQAIKLVMKGKVAGEKIELRVDTDDGAWGTDLVLTRSSK